MGKQDQYPHVFLCVRGQRKTQVHGGMPYACVFFSLKKTGDDQRRKGVDRYGYDSAKKGADLRGAGTIQKNEDRSV